MASQIRTVRMGNFELHWRHLLIVGILVAAFAISFLIRFEPAQYGYELNEFDPFYNYRATQYMVENGLGQYMEWHDDKSWHPKGRDISFTSQLMLHMTAAYTYQAFGSSISLYDYTILFPVIFGSLTAIVVFGLVRVIAGTTAGLLASLLFALSAPVIIRGMLGWFKSEPLGLFYGLLAAYFFLSGITTERRWIAVSKLVGGGITLSFALSAWGGTQYFVMPLAILILILPLLRKDFGFLSWAIPVFVASFAATIVFFERPGLGFLTGFGGLLLFGSVAHMQASIIVQKISQEGKKIRNAILLLAGTAGAGISLIGINSIVQLLPLPSFRYMNAINPFLTTVDPLVDSVAEHATTTTAQSFFFLSILMVFAVAGAWMILGGKHKLNSYPLKLRPDMIAFALIAGILGVYISSAFVRLEVFASVSVIILASIAISILARQFLGPDAGPRLTVRGGVFVAAVVVLLMIPTIVPVQGNWTDIANMPPTLLNGGSNYFVATQDWPGAFEWLRENTPPDAIVMSWWDYGYWITTLGERTTLTDNATMDSNAIQRTASMLLDDPDQAWARLTELDVNYVLVFVTAEKIQNDPLPLYLLTGGGDESKKVWIMRIAAEEPVDAYLYGDGFNAKPYFWENTLFGRAIPFSPAVYVDPATNLQSPEYRDGYTGVYVQDIKYPAEGDGPFRLAYSSESFSRESPGAVLAVMIYEVNPDYAPAAPLG